VRDEAARDDALAIEEVTVQSSDSIAVQMRNGGGFLGRFTVEP
jgi:hypothetical protein